jgi:predicted alpha/beta superfamily hydrolase
MRIFFLVFALVVGLATPLRADSGRVIELPDFPSKMVKPRTVTIWLPPGYDASPDKRYPVLYMHDGQNLFDKAKANFGVEWGVDEAIIRLSSRGDMRPHIVVGMASTDLRYLEYFPRKIFDALPADYQGMVREMDKRAPLSDAYLAFIVRELKPYIDTNYRTLPDASNSSMMGSSMGGLISLYAIGEYPNVFGQVAAVSVHWPLANPEAVAKLSDGAPAQVAAAFRSFFSGSKIDLAKNRIYMDHGTATLDQHYPPYAEAINAMMPTLGWQRDRNWESRAFFGTEHNERAWAERVDIPLMFLDRGDRQGD